MKKKKEIKEKNGLSEDEKEFRETLKCARCGSKQIYTLFSGIRVCRKCSFRE